MAYSKFYNQSGIGHPTEDSVKKAYISRLKPATSTGTETAFAPKAQSAADASSAKPSFQQIIEQSRSNRTARTYPAEKQTHPASSSDSEQSVTQQQQTVGTPGSEPAVTQSGASKNGIIQSSKSEYPVTHAVQGASRDNYLAALDQLVSQNKGKVGDALKYKIQMYEEQLKAQKAALDAQKAENEAALDAEAERLAAEGYENRRQTEADSAKARANWNETANAYGLNSGTQGQAALSFAKQLQSGITALRNAEAQARAEVERQRLTLGQQYQAAIEQAQAENNQQLVQLLYQKALKAEQSSRPGIAYGGPHPWASSGRSNSDTAAANELASKITGDPWTDSNLLSPEYQEMINKEMMSKGLTLEEMDEFLYNRVYPALVDSVSGTRANGDSLKNLVDTIGTKTGRTDFDKFYEWEPESSKSSGIPASSYNPAYSASTPQFGSGATNEYGLSMGTLKSTVGQMLKSGDYSAAENMMDKYAGLLTKSQWNELADIYNKYGYELSKY